MAVLDQWETREGDNDSLHRYLPYISMCMGEERLDPQPPAGWWAMFRYATEHGDLTQLAIWVDALRHAQTWTAAGVERLHMLCREPNGSRVLVVHPVLGELAEAWVETIQGYLEEGFEDDIQDEVQLGAARAYVRRFFAKVPVGRLAEFFNALGLPPEEMMDPKLGWLRDVDMTGELMDLVDGPLWDRPPPVPF